MADYQKPFMSELMSILPSVVSMMMQDKLARDKMATDKERFELTTKATSEFRAGQVKRDITAIETAAKRYESDQRTKTKRYLADQYTKTRRYEAGIDLDIKQHQAIMDEKGLAAGLAKTRYEADKSFKEEQARLQSAERNLRSTQALDAKKIATERHLKEMELKMSNQQAIIDKMELHEGGRVKRHKETQKQITARTELEQKQRKDELEIASVREGNRNINALLKLQQQDQQFFQDQGLKQQELDAQIRATQESEKIKREGLEIQKEINRPFAKELGVLEYQRTKEAKRTLTGYDHFDRVIKDQADDISSDESAMIETWYNTTFQQMIAGDVNRLQDVKKGEPGYENKIQLLNKLIEYKEIFAPSTRSAQQKSPFYDKILMPIPGTGQDFGDPVPEAPISWPFTETTEYNEAQNIGANLELLISLLSQ